MKYVEFAQFEEKKDSNNPFSTLYLLPSGESFYIEPAFYSQLQGFKERHHDKYDLIIEEIINLVKRNKHIVFTSNYEHPLTEVDGYIYLEITDVTNPLKIYVEDKSRGSDYGD